MNLTGGRTVPEFPENRFKFTLESLLEFVFPVSLQHPLAAGRLFCFALYGPLDVFGNIRTGPKGGRTLADYELEQMCMQLEKEDMLQIYLHRSRDMGLLTSQEQEQIISQADAHLKRAKGKAMLPVLTKQDVINLFKDLQKDENGMYSFHDAQNMLFAYRAERIKQYKLVFPQLTNKQKHSSESKAQFSEGTTALTGTQNSIIGSSSNINREETSLVIKKSPARKSRVGESVAPVTMFQKMKGNTNPDLIAQTNKYLSQHAFKLTDIDAPSSVAMTSNVRLLREVPPYCKDPYERSQRKREPWDQTATMKGVGLGSMVNSAASQSTWKRKVTSY